MAQGFYTLEEAAHRLGMGPEELSGMAQRREIRAFADRGTWRFRAQDVEELARQRGVPSDPSVPVMPLVEDTGSGTQEISPFEIQDLTEVMAPPQEDEDIGVDLFASSVDEARRKGTGDSGVFLGPRSDAAFQTAPLSDPGGRGSAIMGGPPKSSPRQPSSATKPPSSAKHSGPQPPVVPVAQTHDEDDSVVPIGRETLGGPGDSSVRLDGLSGLVAPPSSTRLGAASKPPTVKTNPEVVSQAPPSSPDVTPFATSRDRPGSSAEFDFGTTGDFDLTPSSSPSPSDSVFDLSTPSMESIELQITSDLEDGGSSAIDLDRVQRPASGGTMRGQAPDYDVSDDSVTFELSMEEDAQGRRSGRMAQQQPINSSFELSLDQPEDSGEQPVSEESDSDFELTLDDSSSSVEVEEQAPVMSDESESSDFELALDDDSVSEVVDDTGSEVVVLEDDQAVAAASAVVDTDLAEAELDDDDVGLAVVEPAGEAAAAGAVRLSPDAVPIAADWGWWSLMLVPTTLVMLFTGFLLLEMVRNIGSYSEPGPLAAPVYRMMQSFTK